MVPRSIAVSGVVGSGKSSTARAVVELLQTAGVDAEHVRFREFVAIGQGSPRTAGTARGDVAAQDEPRWQGYRRRRLGAAAVGVQLLRILVFRLKIARRPANRVLVFDRYFFDSLAHFELRPGGVLLTVLRMAIPRPTLAALLVVPESTIVSRRPHYSREYVSGASRGYDDIGMTFPDLLVIHVSEHDSVASRAALLVRHLAEQQEPGHATSQRS